jgi:hypothetical protein
MGTFLVLRPAFLMVYSTNRLDDGHYSVITNGHNLAFHFKTITCAAPRATVLSPRGAQGTPASGRASH